MNVLLKFHQLPGHVKKVLILLQHATGKSAYAGVGRLCDGNHETKSLRVDMSAEQEAALFNSRVMGLVTNHENWADHHNLAGTAAELSRGEKGNYTVLVSEFQLVP